MSTTCLAIPILEGKENYYDWANLMEIYLKASGSWEIISGKWQKPPEPPYFRAPSHPQDLIDEHRIKYEADNVTRAVAFEESYDNLPTSPLPPTPAYIEMTIEEAEKRLAYIKNHIEEWDKWNKAERTGINDIYSRISEICKEDLGYLGSLHSIWDRLKTLYIERITVGAWVRELDAVFELRGARKEGENPDNWLRKIGTTMRRVKDKLGELTWDILIGYVIIADLGRDFPMSAAYIYQQTEWPTLESIRMTIQAEYYARLNNRKRTPTSPSDSDEDLEPNLTLTGRKRRGQPLSSPKKRRRGDGKKKRSTCPACNTKHPTANGLCYITNPETAPPEWRQRNKQKIKAFEDAQ